MRQLFTTLIILFVYTNGLSQQLIAPPSKATTVKVEKWNSYTSIYETESISKCYSKVFFYTDMIKIKGAKDQVYFSRNNSGASEQNGYKLVVGEYYDAKGENCIILLSKEIATGERNMVISYTYRTQYTYNLVEIKLK